MATNQTKPSTYSKDVQALYIPQAAEFKATNILLTLVENYYLQGGHTALKVLESPWNFFSIFPGPGKSLKME